MWPATRDSRSAVGADAGRPALPFLRQRCSPDAKAALACGLLVWPVSLVLCVPTYFLALFFGPILFSLLTVWLATAALEADPNVTPRSQLVAGSALLLAVADIVAFIVVMARLD